MWNKLVMVVEFEEDKIQMPSTKAKEEIVYVKFDKNKYSLVTKEKYDKTLIKTKINKEKNDNDK